MKSRAVLAAVVFLMVLSFSTISYAKQLLVNGNFEKGWDNWTFMYNQQNWSPLDLPGGKKALRCWWDGGIKQVVPVVPGKAYELKGDALVPAGGDKEGWKCWVSLSWFDASNNKIGIAWSIAAEQSERGKWFTYDSARQVAPAGAASASADFGVWQGNNAKPANPTDFANFSLEELE